MSSKEARLIKHMLLADIDRRARKLEQVRMEVERTMDQMTAMAASAPQQQHEQHGENDSKSYEDLEQTMTYIQSYLTGPGIDPFDPSSANNDFLVSTLRRNIAR
jgi:hypothetical protein